MKIIMILVYLVCTILGLTFMKLGGNTGTLNIKSNELLLSMNIISFIGFVCYIFSFFIFTRIVTKFELSYIMPILTGIVQVITLIVAGIVFKEKFTIQSIIGASMVIVGIVVMNFSKTN